MTGQGVPWGDIVLGALLGGLLALLGAGLVVGVTLWKLQRQAARDIEEDFS